MRQKILHSMILQTVLSAALISTGCARDKNDSNKSSPPPTTQQQEQKQPEQQAQTGDQQGKSGTVRQEDREIAKLPPPATSVSNAVQLSRIIDPQDDATILFTRMLVAARPEEIQSAKNRLVDEIFADEGEAPLKIVELQAAVAKLAQSGLYVSEPRARVQSLRSKIEERYKQDQYSDVLQKGAIFAATGLLVMGPVAASGAYRHLPEIVPAVRRGVDASKTAWRENVTDRVGSAWRDVKSTVTDPIKRRGAIDEATASARSFGSRIGKTASSPFRNTDKILADNLSDMGVSTMSAEGMGISSFEAVDSLNLPEGLIFSATQKSGTKFATVHSWNGESLGGDSRRMIFSQDRLIRGNQTNTYYVTNPMPADVASDIGQKIAARETAQEPGQTAWVHVVDTKNKVVSSTRMTWAHFKEMLDSVHARYVPLVLSPTSLGVGGTTAAGLAIGYWWGANNYYNYGQTANAMDLEAMIPPLQLPPPSPQVSSQRSMR